MAPLRQSSCNFVDSEALGGFRRTGERLLWIELNSGSVPQLPQPKAASKRRKEAAMRHVTLSSVFAWLLVLALTAIASIALSQ
jgi:hypothetical protein